MSRKPIAFSSQEPTKAVTTWLVGALALFFATIVVIWFGGLWHGFFLGAASLLLLAIAWLFTLVWSLRAASGIKEDKRAALLAGSAPFLALTLALLVGALAASPLEKALNWLWFKTKEATFAQIIEQAQTGELEAQPNDAQSYRGVTYMLDESTPPRVVFQFRYTASTSQWVLPEKTMRAVPEDEACEPLSAQYYLCHFSPGNDPFDEIAGR